MARRDLKGKRVIVTGASSGIGCELAKQLAGEGCRIVLNARRGDRLQELADSLQPSACETVVGDVCESSIQDALIACCVESFGGLDILINNAGVGAIGPFADAASERLRSVMEVNFFAPAELTRRSIPHLVNGNQPMIVNISSVLGHRAVPMKSEYCASKFALHGLSDSIRAELAKHQIDVLIVSPSTTDSEFFDAVLEDSTGKNWKLATAKSPQYVAQRTVRAIKKGKHEIILTFNGKCLVWLDRLMPWLANKIVSRFGQ